MIQLNVFPGAGQIFLDWTYPSNAKQVKLFRATGAAGGMSSNAQEIYQGTGNKYMDQQVQVGVSYTYQVIFYSDHGVEVGRSTYESATPLVGVSNSTQQLQPLNNGWMQDRPKVVKWSLGGLIAVLAVIIVVVLLTQNSKGAAGQVAGAGSGSGTVKVEKQDAATPPAPDPNQELVTAIKEMSANQKQQTEEMKILLKAQTDAATNNASAFKTMADAQAEATNKIADAQVTMFNTLTDKLNAGQSATVATSDPVPPVDPNIQMDGVVAPTNADHGQQDPDCIKKRPLTTEERVTILERTVRRHTRQIKGLRTDVDRHEKILKDVNLEGLTGGATNKVEVEFRYPNRPSK